MIPRTTEVIGEIYPFDKQEFLNYCDEFQLDSEMILEMAPKFGTEMHEWCLEGVKPMEITELHLAVYKQWLAAVKRYKIVLIETETKLNLEVDGEILCSGIRDSISEICAPEHKINGLTQVDLKCYGCWKGLDEPYAEPSKDKLKKANLQTYNYNVAGKDEAMPRAVLHLMPNGFGLYPFKRRPLASYKKFIAICQQRRTNDTF